MNNNTQTTQAVWQCGRFALPLSEPKIMGIVNMTPDSFSDGGTYGQSAASALKHAEQLLHDGADILDIGGESSRPGASYVSPQEEWQRVEPVLRELVAWNIPVTLDTRRTEVMKRALDAGLTDGINDIQALEDDGAVALLAQAESIGICLMHMKGLPENMQDNPQYGDVTAEVGEYLHSRVQTCLSAGIERERLTVDPGFGFGKTLQHNIDLMRHLTRWAEMAQCPVLIGVSRKRMIGELTGRSEPKERVWGSAVAAVAAMARGAAVVRVHDVRETCEAWRVWRSLGPCADVLTFDR